MQSEIIKKAEEKGLRLIEYYGKKYFASLNENDKWFGFLFFYNEGHDQFVSVKKLKDEEVKLLIEQGW